MPDTLPLFPLHSVLLPGAAMDLRIFERRYLDLVRECGRTGRSFGICLVLDGSEVGVPATPAAFGCEAKIEDFGSSPEGLLTLRLRGTRRFHVRKTRIRDTGLIHADVDWREPDSDDPLQPEHAVLGTLLMHLLEQVGGEHANAHPAQLDDAAWVGWRLAELLPLSPQQRLSLLQVDDPHARLERLLGLVA